MTACRSSSRLPPDGGPTGTLVVHGEEEVSLNGVNLKLAPEIRTVFFMAPERFMFVSSSTAKALVKGGADASWLLPQNVESAVREKYGLGPKPAATR